MTALTLERVCKSYGAVEAVRSASFEVADGECVALLGPSGCGKSSTMRMIAGLEAITSGSIRFGDRVINDVPPKERNVALAFESYALYSTLTVWGNLAFPLQSRGMPASEVRSRVATIAQQFRLEDIVQRMPSQLSGGQAQRVSLARALVRQPNVMLLDEPLSHVDYRLRTELRVRIRRIHDETGTTMIYVTHDQEEALALADRIVVMDHAEVQQVGNAQQLWDQPANRFVAGFLGSPSMNFLDAELGDGSARTAAGAVAAPALRTTGLPPAAVLGFRPDSVAIAAASSDDHDGLAGEVAVNEFQGERCFITVATACGQLKAVDDGESSWQPGDKVTLHPRADAIHLFDAQTDAALLNTSRSA